MKPTALTLVNQNGRITTWSKLYLPENRYMAESDAETLGFGTITELHHIPEDSEIVNSEELRLLRELARSAQRHHLDDMGLKLTIDAWADHVIGNG